MNGGKSQKRGPWREVGMYSGIGFAFAVFVFGGFFLGRWLDTLFGTGSWLALTGGLLGFFAVVLDLFMMLRRK